MHPKSTACLAIWHNVNPSREAEWLRWHTGEHMPERLAIPGILAGRRYWSSRASEQCFTIYESDLIETFCSDPL